VANSIISYAHDSANELRTQLAALPNRAPAARKEAVLRGWVSSLGRPRLQPAISRPTVAAAAAPAAAAPSPPPAEINPVLATWRSQPPPPPPVARMGKWARRWALFSYSMRVRRSQTVDELAGRSEVFRRLVGTSSGRDHGALEACLTALALFGLSLALFAGLPFVLVVVVFLPFGALFPFLHLGLSLAGPATSSPSLDLLLPWTLSAIYIALVAALLVLLPIVHRFQSLRSELLPTSGLPSAFFSLVVVAEMRRRCELAIAASSTTTWDHECCVCMTPIEPHDAIVLHGCAHIFHGECITAWLRERSTCPLCRSKTGVEEMSAFTDLAELMPRR